jgi:GNAT superfamily N-acetyltransferase
VAPAAFSIRSATRDDITAIADMLAASAEAQGSRDQLCVDAARLLEDGFGESPRFHALVAEADGRLIGLALYFFTYSTWTSVNTLYLEDLYVDAGWRRQGIARALMRMLATLARDAGCRRVQWLVKRNNASAIRLYESLGAEAAGVWQLMQLRGDALDRA